jgi:heat shock protein HslJ
MTVDVAGCLRYTVAVTVDAHHLTLGKQLGPGSACAGPPPGPATKRMNRITTVLSGRLTWSVTAGRLTLTKSDGPDIGTLVYAAAGADLLDTEWRLVRTVDRTATVRMPGVSATLKIGSDQKLVAGDGCNSISGRAGVHPGTITFGEVVMTTMACTDRGLASAAASVDAMLSGTVRYAIHDGELTLTKAGATTLIYRTATVDAGIIDPAALVGRSWTLTGAGTGTSSTGTASSAAGVSELAFDRAGGFTVRHRCYTNRGKATIGRGNAQLSDVNVQGRVRCPFATETKQGAAENKVVDAALQGAVGWSITGGQLEVVKGSTTLTFTRSGPSALAGAVWRLTGVRRGTAATLPAVGDTTFTFDNTTVTIRRCYVSAAEVDLGNQSAVVAHLRVTEALPCPSRSGEQAQNGLIDTVLAGTVGWDVTGNQLTITKDRVGALVLTRD